MTIRLLQVDTFTDRVLGGNPAAVCPLDAWLDEATMQAIAAENNLSETAFLVPEGEGYRLRWFTPNVEVDLCGHATLAAAFVVFEELRPGTSSVSFETLSGRLTVAREGPELVMDFPAQPARPATPPAVLANALGAVPAEVLAGADWIAVFENAAQIAALNPDHGGLATLDRRGVVATAPGDEGGADYVLRFFAPKNAVPEDPVTGNVQTALVPYWADRLGKRRLAVRQLSARGGRMVCENRGERVSIAGRAVLYMDATISVGR
ncbi:MAG: PhzF family phenazine biosynthesis protein [Rhodospirillaceae bacterium]|nr:PhzF family phenazine biosynthesis protein [Rhodospirillaceae bacterium]